MSSTSSTGLLLLRCFFLLFFVHSWIKGSRAYKMGDEVKKEFDPFGQLHGLFETVLNLVVLPKPQLSVFEVLPVD